MTDKDLNTTKKTLKGFTTAARKTITLQDSVECILNHEQKSVDVVLLENRERNMSIVARSKIALDTNDDKRNILIDKISTLAIGH